MKKQCAALGIADQKATWKRGDSNSQSVRLSAKSSQLAQGASVTERKGLEARKKVKKGGKETQGRSMGMADAVME